MQAAGAGLVNLGGSLGEIAQDYRRKTNTVDLARAEAAKAKGFIDTENAFSNDGDYSTFSQRAPKQTGDIVTKAADLIRDPAMRERWKIGAQTDALRVNDAIGDKARTLGQQAETVAFDDALETNRRIYVDPNTSDEAKAKARADIDGAITTGEQNGLLTPGQAAARRDQYIKNADFSRAKLFTENNPKEVIGWQGVDVSGDIIEAMASVESAGNPNAISGKGAAGIMQVMPETGAEIASELGDTAYPVNGTEAEQQSYLKDPETSVKYGSHYFGKMLKKYGGDKEAALIAYNGGSQRADQWIAAGRDDEAIPKESADYYRKVLSLSGEKPMPFKVEPEQIQSAKAFLQTRTDKDASHIQDMNDTFAVKVARMLQAAPPGIQNDLGIYSGSRTNERQSELWADALKKYGSVAEARKWVAPPEGVEGSKGSQHNHGMAADLSYKGQSLKNAPPEVVSWLHENSSRFGLKFPLSNENWHVEDDSTRGGRPNVRVAANRPQWFNDLSPEEQQVVYNQAETRNREIAVEQRGNIETVTQNAPAAIQNTGTYDGATPSRTEFMDAYGAQDGNERFDKFTAALDVSHQAYNFRTMSADDIQSAVSEAKPVSSGNDAAIETARYDMLSKAAETTLAARKADPAAYTQQAFPNVARAWQDAATTGNYQAAMNVTAQAQQQLGIKDMTLLPKQVADSAVAAFKNPEATDDQRLGAVNSLVFSTADPKQRQAVFKQMVDAGLPAMTEGAVEAAARGDTGAAKRLMQAALTDASKLPKSGDVKPADIDNTLYSEVWAPGSIGDATYGVGYGDASSLERAQRGGELMKKAVQLRISQGQDLEAAVSSASKDLFGDKKVYDGAWSVHANLPVPSDTDETRLTTGLEAAKTSFKAALNMQRDKILAGAKPDVADGGKAIIDTATQNRVDDILDNGVFVVTGDGVGLRDPYTGQFVPGSDGVTPLSLQLQAILDMGAQVQDNAGGGGGGGPLQIDIKRPSNSPGMAPRLGRDMLNQQPDVLRP